MDLPKLPENTVAAFATLNGATVVITHVPDAQDSWAFTWSCLGCDDGSGEGTYKAKARREANGHAGGCRSVPLPTV